MIYYILQIISGLLTVSDKLFEFLNRRQMVDLARTAEQLDSLRMRVNAAHRAVKTRQAVRDALARDTDSGLSDDGFKRPD